MDAAVDLNVRVSEVAQTYVREIGEVSVFMTAS